jgi:hypothetical protein
MEIEIEVSASTPAEENRYANELETVIRGTASDVKISRSKLDSDTLDLGAIIGVLIGSGAATAVAKGIAGWLMKRPSGSITIKKKNGTVIAKGLSSKDALRIAEIFSD